MYCPYCGREIHDDAEYCSFCGKRVKKVSQPKTEDLPSKNTSDAFAPTVSSGPVYPVKNEKKAHPFLILLFVIVILVGAAFGLDAFLRSKSGNGFFSNNVTNTETTVTGWAVNSAGWYHDTGNNVYCKIDSSSHECLIYSTSKLKYSRTYFSLYDSSRSVFKTPSCEFDNMTANQQYEYNFYSGLSAIEMLKLSGVSVDKMVYLKA
jgi:hypothetical protein